MSLTNNYMQYISMEQFLMGRAKLEDLSPELQGNANTIVPRANELLEAFGEYRAVNSGYRRPEDNDATKNSAKKSNHLLCLAVDLEDKDRRLAAFCMDNLPKLKEIGLWMENKSATPTWCHLQAVPPRSKSRIFNP